MIHVLEVCCLIPNYFGILQLSFCYWFLVSFHCGIRTYFSQFPFFYLAKVCFMAQSIIISILENVACKLENNVLVGGNILQMSIRLSSLIVFFKASRFSLIFCLLDLSSRWGYWRPQLEQWHYLFLLSILWALLSCILTFIYQVYAHLGLLYLFIALTTLLLCNASP